MDILNLIIGLIAGGSFYGLIEFFVKRHDDKHKDDKKVIKKLNDLDSKLSALEVSICQNKILALINHFPTDHKAILYELEHYFGSLRADSWVWGIAAQWAREEKVDIGYLEVMHLKNVGEGLKKEEK